MTGSPRYAVARWSALGSYVQLLVTPERLGRAAATRAALLLTEVERCCSRFRPDSELSTVNRRAGERVEVGDLLREAVTVALAAARRTDGLVDPTLGLVLQGLGYDRDLPEVQQTEHRTTERWTRPRAESSARAEPPDAAVTVPLPPVCGSWRDVEVDDRAVRIPFGRALDLGATGKAFAADLVARTLSAELGVDVLVSLGGDVAVGHRPGRGDDAVTDHGTDHASPGEAPGWRVVVCERPEQTATTAGRPGPPGPHEETVSLPSGGLATSSVVRRRWRRDGRELHHLLDPRTGAPVRPVWRTASVIAADCATANGASTAAVILGDRAVGWLADRGLAARLVHADGEVVHVGGWPAMAAI